MLKDERMWYCACCLICLWASSSIFLKNRELPVVVLRCRNMEKYIKKKMKRLLDIFFSFLLFFPQHSILEMYSVLLKLFIYSIYFDLVDACCQSNISSQKNTCCHSILSRCFGHSILNALEQRLVLYYTLCLYSKNPF